MAISLFALCGFYACNFAVLGVWIPYWPLYMSSHGHGAAAIGLIISLSLVAKLLGPPLWGMLADRGSRYRVIAGSSIAACLVSPLFFYGDSLLLLLTGVLAFSLLQNAQHSLVEATTLETIQRYNAQNNRHPPLDYGRIRLWGSWGFVLFALGLGPITDQWGLLWVPWVLTGLLLVGALFSLFLPEGEANPTPDFAPGLFALPSVRWFYLAALLMQFSHGAYYGFLSLHLLQHGFSKGAIGLIWTLGVGAEIFLLRHSGRLLVRFGVSRLLTLSLTVAILRWSLYAMPPAWPLLLVGQLMHAFTFGAFHVAAVRRTFEMAPHASRATAQAWYTALSFGLGGGVGIMLCGQLYDRLGGEWLFAGMAVGATLGLLAMQRALRLFDWERERLHIF
ncbi:MAG: MFS transporter [Magnetococcales bacterium]|nr:MFS transporter [Magnetococcales bacterium]